MRVVAEASNGEHAAQFLATRPDVTLIDLRRTVTGPLHK
jgi:hypothetical protein